MAACPITAATSSVIVLLYVFSPVNSPFLCYNLDG